MAIVALAGPSACSQEGSSVEQGVTFRVGGLEPGEGTFQVLMHGAPYSGDIDAIDVTIERVELVPEDGAPLVVSSEAVAFDLLGIASDNPLELVHADVPSGRYCQMRLVFSEDHTITVDGVQHPLHTPSAEQSGFKLDGCFELTEGFLHAMTVEFSPDESIVHTGNGNGNGKGKGKDKYLLEPKIEIVSNTLVTGSFAVTGLLGDETISAELFADGRIRMISAYDPRMVAEGTYFFNYATSTMHIELGSVTCSSCAGVPSLPASVFHGMPALDVHVTSWDETHIEGSIDVGWMIDVPVAFDASDEMAIDASAYTNLSITVSYPTSDWNGRTGVLSLRPEDPGRGFLDLQIIEDASATFTLMVPYADLPGGVPGGQAEYRARLFVADDVSGLSINAMASGLVCGDLDLSRDEYALTVPVADKILSTSLSFVLH